MPAFSIAVCHALSAIEFDARVNHLRSQVYGDSSFYLPQ